MPKNSPSPKNSPESKKAAGVIARGDCAALRKLLVANPDLAADPRLINEAALHGRPEVFRLLLEAGADPDARVASHEGYRPLHRAIEHRGVPKHPGHREVVEILLETDVSLSTRATWMQLTPLAVAGMAGDEEIIALLLEAGAEVNIFSAAIIGDTRSVRRFLRKKSAASAKDENHMTVLHYAALSGLAGRDADLREIATLLLDAGADGDAREPIGPYPPTAVLHFAAWKNLATAGVLLERGCDPNGGFGNCLWRQPGPMAELFLAHGADLNARESSGQPLLNLRIHWNLTSVVLWMLKSGADPNQPDTSGNTALHEAAGKGSHPKVIEALLAAGANPLAKNHAGQTPLDLARAKKRTRVVACLER